MKWIETQHPWRLLRWVIWDALIIIAAYTVAFSARALGSTLEYIEFYPYFLILAVLFIASLYISRVYHRIWPRTSGHGAFVIVQAIAFVAIPAWTINLLLEDQPVPNSIFVIGTILATGGLIALRYRSRLLSGVSRRWRHFWWENIPDRSRTRVLIIGAGESGQMTAMRLQYRLNAEDQYEIIGFIDDDRDKQGMFVEGKRVLGTREDLPRLVDKFKIDLLVLSIHNIDGEDFRDILSYCEGTRARIKVVPDMMAMMRATQAKTQLRDVRPEDLIGRNIVSRHEAVDLTPVMRRVVLVTGAAGSIGSELCRQMATYDPKHLIMLDNNESSLHDLTTELSARHPELQVTPVLADVTQAKRVKAVFETHRPQIVFHAAAYKHVPMMERYPEEAIRVNIGGTLNIASAARDYDAERFVLISTDKAVKPMNVMGMTKRIGELIIHMLSQRNHTDTLFTAVRFGNVLGSRGSVVPTFERQIDQGGPITVTDPEMTRYFMSISEAVNLVIHAASMTVGDDIFVLRMGEKVKILGIAERMIRLRGLRPYIDVPIEFIGIRPGEKLHEELHTDYETPNPTAHPQIMKLQDWLVGGELVEFENRMQAVLQGELGDTAQAHDTLLGIVNLQ